MSVEVFIPLQTLLIENIKIHPPTSIYPLRIPTSILSYSNSSYVIPKIAVLTQYFIVHSWNAIKGRLELIESESGKSFKSILELQDLLIKTLVDNPTWSSVSKCTNEVVRSKFQHIIYNNIFTLFLNNKGPEGIFVHTLQSSKKLILTSLVPEDLFHQGQKLRIALRFQGLIFLKNTSGKLFYRLQHQIAHIFCT